MSLKLNAPGGGSVTLQEPTTASNVTLNLPADNGTVVYANASGNVGIGTSSPNAPLTVRRTGSGTGVGNQIAVRLEAATAGADNSIQFSDGVTGGIYFGQIGDALRFSTNNTERARIDSSGRLLVGNTSAGANDTKIYIYNSTTSGGANSIISDRSAAGTVGTNHILFNNANGTVGSITTSGSSTGYNTSSDYRLKHDIKPMAGALAKVAALKPVTYKWNADDSDGEGFIAHELAEVCPGAVHGEKDAVDSEGNPVYQGIDTSFLVATLTAAIQELKAEVDSLRAQVEAK